MDGSRFLTAKEKRENSNQTTQNHTNPPSFPGFENLSFPEKAWYPFTSESQHGTRSEITLFLPTQHLLLLCRTIFASQLSCKSFRSEIAWTQGGPVRLLLLSSLVPWFKNMRKKTRDHLKTHQTTNAMVYFGLPKLPTHQYQPPTLPAFGLGGITGDALLGFFFWGSQAIHVFHEDLLKRERRIHPIRGLKYWFSRAKSTKITLSKSKYTIYSTYEKRTLDALVDLGTSAAWFKE